MAPAVDFGFLGASSRRDGRDAGTPSPREAFWPPASPDTLPPLDPNAPSMPPGDVSGHGHTGTTTGVIIAVVVLVLVLLGLLVRRCRRRRATLRKSSSDLPNRGRADGPGDHLSLQAKDSSALDVEDALALEQKRARTLEMLRTRFESNHQERMHGPPSCTHSASTRPIHPPPTCMRSAISRPHLPPPASTPAPRLYTLCIRPRPTCIHPTSARPPPVSSTRHPPVSAYPS
jgi:hypothetical protein